MRRPVAGRAVRRLKGFGRDPQSLNGVSDPDAQEPKKHLSYREIMALSEEERYEHNVYHRWDHAANRRKLSQLYMLIAEAQDREILHAVEGRRVLDVGAGYGFLARRLIDAGFSLTAIDPNEELVGLAHDWFGVEVMRHDIHELPFPAGSFDTTVFREAVEHLDCQRAFEEAARVTREKIIIFQTHLSPAVRLARRLSGHEELRPEGLAYYQDLLRKLGYTRQTVTFHDVLALPISGGTLTPQLVPHVPALERFLVRLDDAATRIARVCRVERLVCWRFLLQAKKPA